MNAIRASLIKTGNIIAAVGADLKVGKTAAKRAKRFAAAAASRAAFVAESGGKPDSKAKKGVKAVVKPDAKAGNKKK